jgi:hypothetical protein
LRRFVYLCLTTSATAAALATFDKLERAVKADGAEGG